MSWERTFVRPIYAFTPASASFNILKIMLGYVGVASLETIPPEKVPIRVVNENPGEKVYALHCSISDILQLKTWRSAGLAN